jgi:hypothetical protein
MSVGGNLMKKEQQIGIITHHYVHNYGAFLQSYALQGTLISLYPSTEIEIRGSLPKRLGRKNK